MGITDQGTQLREDLYNDNVVSLKEASAQLLDYPSEEGRYRALAVNGKDQDGVSRTFEIPFPNRSTMKADLLADIINRTRNANVAKDFRDGVTESTRFGSAVESAGMTFGKGDTSFSPIDEAGFMIGEVLKKVGIDTSGRDVDTVREMRNTVALSDAKASFVDYPYEDGHYKAVSISGVDKAGEARSFDIQYPDRSLGKAAVLVDEINRTGTASVAGDHRLGFNSTRFEPVAVRSGNAKLDREDTRWKPMGDVGAMVGRLLKGGSRKQVAVEALMEHRGKTSHSR